MKKLFISVISLILVIVCLSGCETKPDDILNITEDIFLTTLTDIHDNPESYTGKTIKIEGLFKSDEHNGHSHYYVYRNTSVYDTDHEHDHVQKIGFEFDYSGNLPKENDWIEVNLS